MTILLPLLIALTGAANTDGADEKDSTIAMAHQHMVVNFLSAIYYCKNQHWPDSIGTIRSFKESEGIPLPVEANWEMLQSQSFSFEAGKILVVRSTKGAIPEAPAITSTNATPGCQERNIEIKAHLDIGE